MPTTLLHPYCTLAQVQAECENNDPECREAFHVAINSASRWIDWHCRRDFLYHDHTTEPLSVKQSWLARHVIYLPWPILSLTEVKTGYGANLTALAAGEYSFENPLHGATSRIFRAAPWQPAEAFTRLVPPERVFELPPAITLKGDFGYAPALTGEGEEATVDPTRPSPALPSPINRACTVLAAVWSGKARKDIVDASGTRQSVAMKNVPTQIMEMLCGFQLPLPP